MRSAPLRRPGWRRRGLGDRPPGARPTRCSPPRLGRPQLHRLPRRARGDALVFAGDDILYAAGSNSTSLFRIDPTSGASTSLGDIGAASAGDLAFNGGELCLPSTAGQLVRIEPGPPASGVVVGPFGFFDLFGLATADDGVLYGIAGTVFSVDTTTGAGTLEVDYANQGVGPTFGSSFVGEALPSCPGEPLVGCPVAAKAKLVASDKRRGREKFKLLLKGFDGATGQADFGFPVDGATIYEVCVFDDRGLSAVRLTRDDLAFVQVAADGAECYEAELTTVQKADGV